MDPQKPLPAPADSEKPAAQDNITTTPTENTAKPEATVIPAAPSTAVNPAESIVKPEGPAASSPAPAVVSPGAAGPSPVHGSHVQSPVSADPSWPVVGGGTPSMPANSSVPKPKKKGLLIGLAVVLAVLVLGGGAAAAYYSVIVPNKPENVLKAALANSFSDKIKSQHIKGEGKVTSKADKQSYSADFTGAANSSGALQFKMNLDVAVTKANMEIRSVDGKDFYVKVGGLEGLPELMAAGGEESVASLYAPMVSGLNNQWIEITESMISNLTGQSGTMKLSDADREKLKQAYLDHEFLVIKESLKDEKINGKNSYHYKVAVEKQQLQGFLKAVKDAKIDSLKITQDDLDSFNDSIKDVDFNKYPVEVWISKDQKFINQIKFDYQDKESTLTATVTVTEYNTPVNVTKPSGAKSLMEVLGGLYGGTGGTGDAQILEGLEGSGISL